MIDRETAIQWAKEAGFPPYEIELKHYKEQLQALITRAMNEAFEEAALVCDKESRKRVKDSMFGIWSSVAQCGYDIRALKQEPPK